MIIAWLAGFGPEPDDTEARQGLARIRKSAKAAHFCQIRMQNATPRAFAESIAAQLKDNIEGFNDAFLASQENLNITVQLNIGTANSATGLIINTIDLGALGDEQSLDRSFIHPIKKLYERGYRESILILVDALDEAHSYTGVGLAQWLSRINGLPATVRVLVTTRRDQRVLKFFRQTACDLIDQSPDRTDEVRIYAARRLSELTSAHAGKRNDFAARLASTSHGIFLYAALVLDELARNPDKLPKLADYHLPDGISGLYQEFLCRELIANEQLWFSQYEPLLGLVSVAQGDGLTAKQLSAIVGGDIRQPLRVCAQYLDGELPEGPFRPFHQSFTDFLLEDEQNIHFRIDGARWHRAIALYYRNAFMGRWVECDAYGLTYVLVHALEGGDPAMVDELIGDVGFLVAADPDSVMRGLPFARGDSVRDLAWAYARVAHALRDAPSTTRLSYIEMSLSQNRVPSSGVTGTQIRNPDAPWAPAWTDCVPTVRHWVTGRHEAAIYALSSGYINDQPYIASGDLSGVVRISDARTGALIASLPDRSGDPIQALASFSGKDEAILVVGDLEGLLECWDLIRMERLWRTKWYHWEVNDIVITSVLGRCAVISCSDIIVALDLRTGKKIRPSNARFPSWLGFWRTEEDNDEDGPTNCLASYTIAGQTFLVSCRPDGVVRIWDADTGDLIKEIRNENVVSKVGVFDQDGGVFLVIAGNGLSIKVINARTYEIVAAVDATEDKTYVPSIAVGRINGEPVIYSAGDQSVGIQGALDGRIVGRAPGPHSNWVRVMTLAKLGDETRLLLAGGDQIVYVVDESDLALAAAASTGVSENVVTALGRVDLNDDEYLICGHADGAICLREMESGRRVGGTWTLPGRIGSIDSLTHGGTSLLACQAENDLWLTDAKGAIRASISSRKGKIVSTTLGLVNGRPVVALGTDNGSLETYELEPQLTKRAEIEHAHRHSLLKLARPELSLANVSALAIYQVGGAAMLASVGWEDHTLKLWDWETMSVVSEKPAGGYVSSLESIIVGSRPLLMSMSTDLRLRVWAGDTGEMLRERLDERRRGHVSGLWYTGMTCDRVAGRELVVIGARDGTITVIEASDLSVVTAIAIGYGDLGRRIVLSRSGTLVVAGARGLTAVRLNDSDRPPIAADRD